MMVNNAGNVFKLCISTALQPVKIKAKDRAIEVRVIFHISQ